MNTSVRPATVSAGKTALAIVAILSLLLSLIAIVRPAIAFHDAENVGPEVTPTAEEFTGGEPQCPEGMTAIRFNDPTAGDDADVLLSDGTTATVTIISSNGTLTFEVENGLAAIVKVKGGVSTPGVNDQNVYDYTGSIEFPGPGIAHDDGLTTPNQQGVSHVDFCLIPLPKGSILIYKDDQTGAPVGGATFSVKNEADEEVGVIETDDLGFGCLDELPFGDYTVTETLAPDGWLPDPDTESVTVDSESTCAERLDGAVIGDADATFTNTLLGSLLVLKTDGTDPLDGAVFSVEDSEGTAVNGPFTSGDDGTGLFCVDGLVFGEEYTVTETDPPAGGYSPDPVNPKTHVIDNSDDCATRLDTTEIDPDLTFVNTLEETGSITVIKEVDCEDCETRTIGYYFNTADQHEEETNALFADLGGITADGILFTNVDQVQQYRADDQDGTSDGQNGLSARGQLTLQYLAAQLNVARNGEECDLASRVYNNADSPFDGWTVQEILDEADLAFAGTSTFTDQEIKSALDDINNSSHEEENPLSCEGTENGTLDGVTFDLFLEEDYPDGDPIDSQTTAGGGMAVFEDLALDMTYVLVESGFPEGMTCEIVDVVGEGFEFTLNDDGSVTIVLTENNPDVTLTVVNDCEEDEEEELGSLLIAKEDDEGASLGGATFEVDGIEHADTDEDGFVCVDGLTLGDIVSVEETVAPDGFIGEEGAHDVPILNTDDCETRLAGEDLQADADITFVNVPEEDTGEIELTKVDEEGATLPGATFKLYLDDGDDVFDPEDGAGNGDGGSGSCTGDANVSAVSNDGTGATAIANAVTADGATLTAASFASVTAGTPNGTAGCLSWFATNGNTFGILTSGDVSLADDPNDDGGAGIDNGGANVRGDTDFDVTVLKLDLTTPAGANCLRFDFAFYSEEFPEFVNTSFNDAFIAELNSSTWTTDGSDINAPNNFAFDPNGDVISINSTGATAMNEANADGTTYDGATVLLSAATPVGAGANSLYLSIFDQGDGILDSAVFLDNVRFQTVANVATDCVAGAQEAPAGGDVLIETKDTGGDGTALFSNLEAGTYWLQETEAPDGCVITEELTKVVLTEADILAGVPISVEVENDCEQPPTGGSITIIKDAAPNNAQDFAFTTTGTGLSSFTLDDDADAALTNQKVFTSLAAGSYTVVETETTGWTLTSITCSTGGSGNTTTRTASITLTASENVICTFLNTLQAGGTLPGNPATPPGGAVLGGNPAVPNTAMETGLTGAPAAAVLALLMLSGLVAAGYAARAEVRRRR